MVTCIFFVIKEIFRMGIRGVLTNLLRKVLQLVLPQTQMSQVEEVADSSG